MANHRQSKTLLPAVPILAAIIVGIIVRGEGAAAQAPESGSLGRGRDIYFQTCALCHGAEGQGVQRQDSAPGVRHAPGLANSPRVSGNGDYIVSVLLHGMRGPVDGVEYQEAMVPFAANGDAWIADVATFVRGSFGNRAPPVMPADVARVRAAEGRRGHWTQAELEARLGKAPAR